MADINQKEDECFDVGMQMANRLPGSKAEDAQLAREAARDIAMPHTLQVLNEDIQRMVVFSEQAKIGIANQSQANLEKTTKELVDGLVNFKRRFEAATGATIEDVTDARTAEQAGYLVFSQRKLENVLPEVAQFTSLLQQLTLDVAAFARNKEMAGAEAVDPVQQAAEQRAQRAKAQERHEQPKSLAKRVKDFFTPRRVVGTAVAGVTLAAAVSTDARPAVAQSTQHAAPNQSGDMLGIPIAMDGEQAALAYAQEYDQAVQTLHQLDPALATQLQPVFDLVNWLREQVQPRSTGANSRLYGHRGAAQMQDNEGGAATTEGSPVNPVEDPGSVPEKVLADMDEITLNPDEVKFLQQVDPNNTGVYDIPIYSAIVNGATQIKTPNWAGIPNGELLKAMQATFAKPTPGSSAELYQGWMGKWSAKDNKIGAIKPLKGKDGVTNLHLFITYGKDASGTVTASLGFKILLIDANNQPTKAVLEAASAVKTDQGLVLTEIRPRQFDAIQETISMKPMTDYLKQQLAKLGIDAGPVGKRVLVGTLDGTTPLRVTSIATADGNWYTFYTPDEVKANPGALTSTPTSTPVPTEVLYYDVIRSVDAGAGGQAGIVELVPGSTEFTAQKDKIDAFMQNKNFITKVDGKGHGTATLIDNKSADLKFRVNNGVLQVTYKGEVYQEYTRYGWAIPQVSTQTVQFFVTSDYATPDSREKIPGGLHNNKQYDTYVNFIGTLNPDVASMIVKTDPNATKWYTVQAMEAYPGAVKDLRGDSENFAFIANPLDGASNVDAATMIAFAMLKNKTEHVTTDQYNQVKNAYDQGQDQVIHVDGYGDWHLNRNNKIKFIYSPWPENGDQWGSDAQTGMLVVGAMPKDAVQIDQDGNLNIVAPNPNLANWMAVTHFSAYMGVLLQAGGVPTSHTETQSGHVINDYVDLNKAVLPIVTINGKQYLLPAIVTYNSANGAGGNLTSKY